MPWHIIVEAEDGHRESAGSPSSDLGAIMKGAIALADELGRMPARDPRDCRVDIVAGDGEIELSITIIPGGLDRNEADPGSTSI